MVQAVCSGDFQLLAVAVVVLDRLELLLPDEQVEVAAAAAHQPPVAAAEQVFPGREITAAQVFLDRLAAEAAALLKSAGILQVATWVVAAEMGRRQTSTDRR
jgi:hypothetical protein